MKAEVFSVYDLKARSYAQPFFSHSEVTAQRAYADASLDPGSMLCKHPEDFRLFHIGTFDDQTGSLIPCPVPVPLDFNKE